MLCNKYSPSYCEYNSYSIFFLTLELPADFVDRLCDQRVTEGANVELTVKLTKPNVKVKWNKDGHELKESDRVKFVKDGNTYKVVISNCQLDDTEQYICILPDGKKSKGVLTVEGTL